MGLTAIHPGEHLAEELQALNMSAAELARKIQVPTNRIRVTGSLGWYSTGNSPGSNHSQSPRTGVHFV